MSDGPNIQQKVHNAKFALLQYSDPIPNSRLATG